MKLGLEIFLERYKEEYKGKKIGLVTNPTGVDKNFVSTIDLLNETLQLSALFSPEHGIRANIKEGEKFGDSIDEVTGLPVYSLYGETKKPTKRMMDDLDLIIFDIQDIGSRYYTFIYTLANVMEACQAFGKEVVVFDRPNPIGGTNVEGNIIKDGYYSFVGMFPIPIRHGMTIGELALLFNNHFHIHCDLKVIKMEGWQRNRYFDELNLPWVAPSPNVTGISMQLLYPGTCLIEGTNLSEGRGTVLPFEIVGAPFIDARALAKQFNELNIDGVIARPISFMPTYQKYSNENCHGVQLHVIDRDSVRPVVVGLKLLEIIHQNYPNDLTFIENEEYKRPFFDLLAGDSEMRYSIISQQVDLYLQKVRKDVEEFMAVRKQYLIYD